MLVIDTQVARMAPGLLHACENDDASFVSAPANVLQPWESIEHPQRLPAR